MKLEINPRGNGACPLCSRISDCAIRNLLTSSIANYPDPVGSGLEIALYACPSFIEKESA
ncbi:MAG: hypothetical protein WCL50_18680 [Spirochaetota bacterium]